MKIFHYLFLFIFLGFFLACSPPEQEAAIETDLPEAAPTEVPVKGSVTLVDFGADTCVPCKLMAPILEELKAEYKGKAEVIYINVWEESNIERAQEFEVMTIPTQVFFNRQGEEVFRHVGFMDKESIVNQLEPLLARKKPGA